MSYTVLWRNASSDKTFLILEAVINQLLCQRVILFHLRIDNLRICVWFGVVDDIALDLLLGSSLIAIYVLVMFRAVSRLVSRYQWPIKK